MSAVYIEFTEYYYPDGKDFPSKRLSCYHLFKTWEIVFFLAKFFSFINVKKEAKVNSSLLLLSLCVVYDSSIALLYIICSYVLSPH